jgi:hypothetical protein
VVSNFFRNFYQTKIVIIHAKNPVKYSQNYLTTISVKLKKAFLSKNSANTNFRFLQNGKKFVSTEKKKQFFLQKKTFKTPLTRQPFTLFVFCCTALLWLINKHSTENLCITIKKPKTNPNFFYPIFLVLGLYPN